MWGYSGARAIWQYKTEPSVRAPRRVRKAVQPDLGRRLDAMFDPAAAIRGLAWGAIARWKPAMQNIIARLPLPERQAAAEDAERMLRDYVRTLSKLHALVPDSDSEYRRWEHGFGAADMALVEALSMVGYAKEVAARMEPGDQADMLRKAVGAAWDTAVTAMAQLAEQRLCTLRLDSWQYHTADMVAFARADGGIGPALEVLYHAPGSKFMGC
jgi:hypothetical protein